MEYWLNFSMLDIDQLVPLAQVAESFGFAGVSMGDHLIFPRELKSPYPYSKDGSVMWRPEDHWPDCWVAIAAMAASTARLKFTTGVYIMPLREPMALAKALATAAHMSGGRVYGGFGAGWMREEFDYAHERFEGRGARMDEMIEILRKLWTGQMVEHRGDNYDLPGVQMAPAPPPIPILIGGNNDAALRRAARNDGWIGVHRTFEATEPLAGKVKALRAEAGAAGHFTLMLNAFRTTEEDRVRIAELGFEALVLPVAATSREASLQARIEGMRRLAGDLALA